MGTESDHPSDGGPHVRERHFQGSRQAAPDRRAAYLDQACGSDAELAVKSNRSCTPTTPRSAFLRMFRGGPDPTEDYQPIAERPGTVIGPYQLMEQIGEGGMGLVFLAEHSSRSAVRSRSRSSSPGWTAAR